MIRPWDGSISRLIMRRTVDFPQPDGPISTTSSPAAMSRDSASTATVPSGYVLPTPSRVIGAADPFTVPSTYVPPGRTGAGLRRGGQSLVLLAVRAAEHGDPAGRAAGARVADRRGGADRPSRRRPPRRPRVLVPPADRTDSRIHRRAV